MADDKIVLADREEVEVVDATADASDRGPGFQTTPAEESKTICFDNNALGNGIRWPGISDVHSADMLVPMAPPLKWTSEPWLPLQPEDIGQVRTIEIPPIIQTKFEAERLVEQSFAKALGESPRSQASPQLVTGDDGFAEIVSKAVVPSAGEDTSKGRFLTVEEIEKLSQARTQSAAAPTPRGEKMSVEVAQYILRANGGQNAGVMLPSRSIAKQVAEALGYFWLPCPLCGEDFAGFEVGGDIPDGQGGGQCTCSSPSCIKAARVVTGPGRLRGV